MNKFIDYKNKLEQLDQLIRLEATGSPRELADKMNVSERKLFRLIELMKEMGGQIYFSNNSNSYRYDRPCRLSICYQFSDLDKVKGGRGINYYFAARNWQ